MTAERLELAKGELETAKTALQTAKAKAGAAQIELATAQIKLTAEQSHVARLSQMLAGQRTKDHDQKELLTRCVSLWYSQLSLRVFSLSTKNSAVVPMRSM